MSKIVEMPRPKSDLDQEAIEELEKILVRAKAGEINGFAAVVVYADGDVTTGWGFADGGRYHSLVGGLAHLQHRLIGREIEIDRGCS